MAVNQIPLSFLTGELAGLYTQLNQFIYWINQDFTAIAQSIGLAGLQAAPYSFSAADAQAIMNSLTDLQNLALVIQGLKYVTPGASAGAGVPTANDGTHFGYSFIANVAKTGGAGR